MALTEDGRSRVLNNGVEMPLLGLGVWQIPDGKQTEQAVRWALEAGYRHIDTAAMYRNEQGVGQGLRDSGVPRDEVFVATKFAPRDDDPEQAIERSLTLLGLDHVDLYLWHWPSGSATKHWPAFERIAARGLARAVGVSNFSAGQIRALAGADTPPAVNQVEFSPFQFRRGLLDACEDAGVVLEAYSPLTRGHNLGDRVIAGIAAAHDRTAAQVLLRWAVQRDLPVIPKSANQGRIEENAQIFGWELSDDEMRSLDALDKTGGTDDA